MGEVIRTVPADKHFPGMTEIEINGRTIACVGVGKRVERAIKEKFERENDRA